MGTAERVTSTFVSFYFLKKTFFSDQISKKNKEEIADYFRILQGGEIKEYVIPWIEKNNPKIREIIKECILNRKPVVYESLNRTTNGETIWESSTLTPIFDTKGELKKLVIIDTDITDRKNAEEIIQQKNKASKNSL